MLSTVFIGRIPPLVTDLSITRGGILPNSPKYAPPPTHFFRRLRRARQSQTPFSNVSEHVGYFTIAFCHLYDSLKNVKVFQNIKKFYEVFYFSSDILILWFCLSAIGWRFPY